MEWFPEYFIDEERAFKIVDGIVHHMYPFPVRRLNGKDLELNNNELLQKSEYASLLIMSTSNRKHYLSLKRSKSLEGKIVSKADKINSLDELRNSGVFIAFILKTIKIWK